MNNINKKVLSKIKRLQKQAIQAETEQNYQSQHDKLTRVKEKLLALKASTTQQTKSLQSIH